jgi:DnaJ-domain-containing protein 1
VQQQTFGSNRRSRPRVRKILGPILDLTVVEGRHRTRLTKARLVDFHEGGVGFQCPEAISPGSSLRFVDQGQEQREAKVIWCQKSVNGEYKIGAVFEGIPGAGNDASSSTADSAAGHDPDPIDDNEPDYYELLQINPKADVDTIHRVYRFQAQRFHPDNKETGNEATFRLLSKAYQTLSDPEKRAGYDLRLSQIQQRRWKIFEKPVQAMGLDAERSKRKGILSVLCTKRMQEPATPFVSMNEVETLLGVPKEHLEFTLWYLKESGFVTRNDNGRIAITIKGVDELEKISAEQAAAMRIPEDRLLAPAH